MTFDAVALEIGTVRLADLQATGVRDDEVAVVLLTDGGNEHRAIVSTTDKASGRGVHRAMRCPRCGKPAGVLRHHEGVLQCARCWPHRTSQQRQSNLAWWRRDGGRQTDQLLRLALGRHRPGRLEKMQALADELVLADEQRLSTLLPHIGTALDGGVPVMADVESVLAIGVQEP